MSIPRNLTCREEYVVTDDLVTRHLGDIAVLSTPSLVLLFEKTANNCVQPYLPEEYATVGVYIGIKHLNPVPKNESVVIEVSVSEIDGKKIVYTVKSFWKNIVVGEGVHERYIVNVEKFKEKILRLINETS